MPQTNKQKGFHTFRRSPRFAQYQDLARENGLELDWRHESGEEGGDVYLRTQGDPDWCMLENSEAAIREELAAWGVDLRNLSEIPEQLIRGEEWRASSVDFIEQGMLAAAQNESPSDVVWEEWCAAATGKGYAW